MSRKYTFFSRPLSNRVRPMPGNTHQDRTVNTVPIFAALHNAINDSEVLVGNCLNLTKTSLLFMMIPVGGGLGFLF